MYVHSKEKLNVDVGVMLFVQVPAAVVSFKWDPSVMKDILAAQGQVDENVFLKPELLQRAQELSQKTIIIRIMRIIVDI